MKYTAFVDTWQGTHELGTYSNSEEAHAVIESFSYEAGLRLGVDCSGCVVEQEGNTMDKFVEAVNKALDEQKWVRIHNSYEDGTTKLVVDGKTVMVLRDTIVYPGFINCTKKGTSCRIVKATKGLGFGSERAKGWSDYHLEISNEYNSYDVIAEDEDPYYGSDRYFEDGFEAGYYC